MSHVSSQATCPKEEKMLAAWSKLEELTRDLKQMNGKRLASIKSVISEGDRVVLSILEGKTA